MVKRESLTFDNVAAEVTDPVLADINDSIGGPFKRRKGIFVSHAVIFIYILVTILIALAVGLIVFFAHPYRNKASMCLTNDIKSTKQDNVTLQQFCLDMLASLNQTYPTEASLPSQTTTSTTDLPTLASPTRGLRLPTALKPFHYNVDLKPNIYETGAIQFTFEGTVDIFLVCEEETNMIVVNFKLLYIYNTSIIVTDLSDGRDIPVIDMVQDHKRDFCNITLGENLVIGQSIQVTMNFSGPLFMDMAGLYWSSYPKQAGLNAYDGPNFLASTQLEATDARKTFPCLDEPQLKATFNISVWRKEPMIALSNMPNYTTKYMGDGWYKDYFLKTPVVMPTYLVAITVANYDYIERYTSGGESLNHSKYMRYFSRPEFIANGYADYAADVSSPIFDYYEEYFNETYPLPKTDQLSIPDFGAGAMENWGLITYRESRLIMDPSYTTQFSIWKGTKTMAHELLHQWLGNIVTVAWWDDLWLQEGAARYFENFGVQHARPEWDMMTTYLALTFPVAMTVDQKGNNHQINNPGIEMNSEVETMFSSITYDKGSTVFRMVDQYIFRQHRFAFEAAMRNYMKKYKYKSVQHDDLLTCFDEAAAEVGLDINITAIVYTWIKQSNFPMVTFSRSDNGQTVNVEQKIFLINPLKPIIERYPSPYNYSWEVPLSYYTSVDTSAVQFDWLHKENKTIHLKTPLGPNDWLIGNFHRLGFYRVNYDNVTWEAIINQLQTDFEVINVFNRGQILDDAFNMGRSMDTDQLHSLRATEYLYRETEYLPWYLALQGIRYTDVILSSMPQYGLFREYMADLLTNNYLRLGWTLQENLLDVFLQMITITAACKYNTLDCTQKASSLFNQWMKQPDNLTIIAPDFRPAVYCFAIQSDSTSTSWDFLYEQYQRVDHEIERMVMRDALGCAQQSWLLYRYFEMGAKQDPRVYYLDYTSVMRAVARNYPSGTIVAFDYLSQKWDRMTGTKFNILRDITARWSTPHDLQKFIDFTQHHPYTNTVEMEAYNDMHTTILTNIKWRTLNQDNIEDWIVQARKTIKNNLR